MGPQAAILPCGQRLHLQHGPIELVIGVDQNHGEAFRTAHRTFENVLEELVGELADLDRGRLAAGGRVVALD